MAKKILLSLTSALLIITPFLFLPGIEQKESFRLPKEVFSLFMISVICGVRGIVFVERSFAAAGKLFLGKVFLDFLKKERLYFVLLLFCLYIFISSFFSSAPGISLRVSFNILLYTLFFIFLLRNISTRGERRLVTNSLVYPGVLMSAYSFFQYFGHDPVFVPVEPYMKRFLLTSGFIDNPNLFAGYLVALIPVALAGVITGKKGGGKMLSAISFLLMVTALLLTSARTGLIAFLVSLMFFIFSVNRWSIRKYLLSGTVLVILLSSVFIVTNIVYLKPSRKSMELPDKSFSVRLIHWKSAWLMITESPRSFIFGKGAGTFRLHYLDYRVRAVKDIKASVRFENSHHSHNEYIQLWAESGAAAIIFAGIILFLFVKTTLSLYRNEKISREARVTAAGFQASFLAVLVNALASFPFHIAPSALAAVTAAALSISVMKENRSSA